MMLGNYNPEDVLFKYERPSSGLLKQYTRNNVDSPKNLEILNKIVQVLSDFGIEVEPVTYTIGPTVTTYEFQLGRGTKVSKLKGLEDDLTLHLGVDSVRILTPIKGKPHIGFEIPNDSADVVGFKSLIESDEFQNSDMQLPIAMGETTDGTPYVFDLAKMPHLLIAGATGQGKSVGINNIIMSLLYKQHPTKLKMVLIDVKKVELNIYNKLDKHFLVKSEDVEEDVVTEIPNVLKTINALCGEMDKRYDMLKEAGCRNVIEYNKKFCNRELNPSSDEYLPYIVCVIDEFADLIMQVGKDIEQPIARLAQLARAVGIHLVIATQRPSANVITGLIKANFPSRISFRVMSSIDSRVILDSMGAERLIGRGDMLISHNNEVKRLQCGFVDTPEVDRVVKDIQNKQGNIEISHI